jgi:hypothetical protein
MPRSQDRMSAHAAIHTASLSLRDRYSRRPPVAKPIAARCNVAGAR